MKILTSSATLYYTPSSEESTARSNSPSPLQSRFTMSPPVLNRLQTNCTTLLAKLSMKVKSLQSRWTYARSVHRVVEEVNRLTSIVAAKQQQLNSLLDHPQWGVNSLETQIAFIQTRTHSLAMQKTRLAQDLKELRREKKDLRVKQTETNELKEVLQCSKAILHDALLAESEKYEKRINKKSELQKTELLKKEIEATRNKIASKQTTLQELKYKDSLRQKLESLCNAEASIEEVLDQLKLEVHKSKLRLDLMNETIETYKFA